MSMIEKCARALAVFNTDIGLDWREWVGDVEIVLEALREPTPEMERAAFGVLEVQPGSSGFATGTDARNAIFRAMISAALTQGGGV